jgi:NADH pyrophosphatase NudC (nudix superfamily)
MVHAFAAYADGTPVELDEGEIAQARWFPHDALPGAVTPYTRGMVARAYWELFRS